MKPKFDNEIPYLKNQFPPTIRTQNRELQKVIAEARINLGRYDGVVSAINWDDVFPYREKFFIEECIYSSLIENIDVDWFDFTNYFTNGGKFQNEDNWSENALKDLEEVYSYSKAFKATLKELNNIPFSQRLIKFFHNELMNTERGKFKSPGEYRRSEVWIVTGENITRNPDGETKVERTAYIPPSHIELSNLLTALEKYVHEADMDELIKAAVFHAEFESIHPFLDGNGRTGRGLIPIQMKNDGIIQERFFMSEYFWITLNEYYEQLLQTSLNVDWTDWCIYFIKGIDYMAKKYVSRIIEGVK